MTTQEYADLLTLARSAYDAYYPQWLHDDSHELIIANIAVKMGIAGCSATFAERKMIVREMIERMSHDTEEYRLCKNEPNG